MQRYHLEIELIPEYINKLEDLQAKSKWANNPITNVTLVIIATNVMIVTEQFSRTSKDWD